MAPRTVALLVGLALGASLAIATAAEPTSHLLDGMAFVGLNGEKGRPLDPDRHEEMVFEEGRFRSVSCEPYNFGKAACTAARVGDAVHFQAETVSPTHGRIAWQGVVEGDSAWVPSCCVTGIWPSPFCSTCPATRWLAATAASPW